MYFRMIGFLFLLPLATRAEVYVWNETWKSVAQLEEILKTIPEGQSLWEAALKVDPNLTEHIQPGSASFSENKSFLELLANGKLSTNRQEGAITIKREHKLADAVADLAHELLHYSKRSPLDPLSDLYGIASFIRHGIEGPGGELTAFAKECELVWLLENKHPAFPPHQTCQRYRKTGDIFDLEAARRDFYAIGRWESEFDSQLHRELPALSSREPIFTSGLSKKPYPVTLKERFPADLHDACVSSLSKYQYLARRARSGHALDIEAFSNERSALVNFLRKNCDLNKNESIQKPHKSSK